MDEGGAGGVEAEFVGEFVDRPAESDAGQHGQQKPPFGVVHQRGVRRYQRQAGLLRKLAHPGKGEPVLRAEKQARERIGAIAEGVAPVVQSRQHGVSVLIRCDMPPERNAGEQSRRMLRDIGEFSLDEWVEGEAWRKTDGLGVFVIVERSFVGLLPASEPNDLGRGDAARFRRRATIRAETPSWSAPTFIESTASCASANERMPGSVRAFAACGNAPGLSTRPSIERASAKQSSA